MKMEKSRYWCSASTLHNIKIINKKATKIEQWSKRTCLQINVLLYITTNIGIKNDKQVNKNQQTMFTFLEISRRRTNKQTNIMFIHVYCAI